MQTSSYRTRMTRAGRTHRPAAASRKAPAAEAVPIVRAGRAKQRESRALIMTSSIRGVTNRLVHIE